MKAAIFILAAAPLADLIILTAIGGLGTNPQETLLRATGAWCLVLLLATLSVTPLQRWLHWPELVRLRRMLGLWAFAYALVHLLGFWAFEHDFVWLSVAQDSLKRPFVTVGLITLLLMLPLALTSNAWSMRTLGPSWKALHRLVYLIALLGCLHFFLHTAGKNDFTDPTIALIVTLVLLSARRIRWRGSSRS